MVAGETDLLDEGGAVLAEVPPLEDEDEAGDERRGARQRHVELGRQSAQERGRVPHCRARRRPPHAAESLRRCATACEIATTTSVEVLIHDKI